MVEHFVKIVWQGSEYASELLLSVNLEIWYCQVARKNKQVRLKLKRLHKLCLRLFSQIDNYSCNAKINFSE